MEKRTETGTPRVHFILRDRLAENRTTLANERTLLSYIRTALTLFAVGVTFFRFFEYPLIELIGLVLIPLGIFTFIRGLISYRKTLQVMKEEEKETIQSPDR